MIYNCIAFFCSTKQKGLSGLLNIVSVKGLEPTNIKTEEFDIYQTYDRE